MYSSSLIHKNEDDSHAVDIVSLLLLCWFLLALVLDPIEAQSGPRLHLLEAGGGRRLGLLHPALLPVAAAGLALGDWVRVAVVPLICPRCAERVAPFHSQRKKMEASSLLVLALSTAKKNKIELGVIIIGLWMIRFLKERRCQFIECKKERQGVNLEREREGERNSSRWGNLDWREG